jgi:hypothetical protein
MKMGAKVCSASSAERLVLQNLLSLSAKIFSWNVRCPADSAPAPTYSLSPCYFCVCSDLFINNLSYSRWCRQAAARLRAPKGDAGHLASSVPEDAGSTCAHAQRCGVSS